MSAETCVACRSAEEPGTLVEVAETDDIALCDKHWARWVVTYVGSPFAPEPPCSAHLIEVTP